MDQDCTCHYFFRCLSFLGYQVVGLASPAAYSGPGSPLSLTQSPTLGGSGAPRLLVLDSSSSVVLKMLGELLELEVLVMPLVLEALVVLELHSIYS